MRHFATALVLAAAGCAPMEWQKQDVTADQLRKDEAECRQAAWREANYRSWMYQRVSPVVGPGFVIWPSGAYADPFAHQLLEENRLAQFCMESKGYKLEPAPKQ